MQLIWHTKIISTAANAARLEHYCNCNIGNAFNFSTIIIVTVCPSLQKHEPWIYLQQFFKRVLPYFCASLNQIMQKIILLILLTGNFLYSTSQNKKKLFQGMYLQWGYNTEWYTNSTIHFKDVVDGVNHDFTIYKAKAHDRNDLDAIIKKPIEISIPQYNYRIGFYLNATKTKALEINYDHTKYIVYDNQLLRAKGTIGTTYFDKDTAFTRSQVHLEHTNGANFYQVNYVRQYTLKNNKSRPLFTALWKAGAGVLIPKTDVTLSGKRVDNKFHVAGYCLGVEGGGRWYFAKKWFVEATAKTGFANYTNSLAAGGGRINHSFGYLEFIGTVGYDIKF